VSSSEGPGDALAHDATTIAAAAAMTLDVRQLMSALPARLIECTLDTRGGGDDGRIPHLVVGAGYPHPR
jgi:hypothetical protein